jgi:N-glycosylase/DNA lyase
MKDLAASVEQLRQSEVKKVVEARMREFKNVGKGACDGVFKELCFCLLTANYSAAGGIRIQKAIDNGFITLPEDELANRLRQLGHRFWKKRAEYIYEARKHNASLKNVIASYRNETDLREWIVKNVKGLGYKEASHFLRNIGFENLAIIDFHIIDILARNGMIKKPKTLTRRQYLEIERVLLALAGRLGISLAELDLYLWYMETGKILK